MEAITVPVNEAAKALGIGRVTLYRHMADDTIDSVRIGGRRLVKVESLRRLVDGHSAAPKVAS